MAFLPRLVLNPGSLLLAQHVDNVQGRQMQESKGSQGFYHAGFTQGILNVAGSSVSQLKMDQWVQMKASH